MRNKLPTLLVFCCLLFGEAMAQPYYFKHYYVESGLSNNSVACSLQDQNGFLWFGTINGLNRFDGYSFKVFRHNPEDSNSIGSNFIRCLYDDKKGNIWAGTNKGIYIYNTHSEQFSRFGPQDLTEVSDIKPDKQGNLWLISNANLYRYDPKSNNIKSYSLEAKPHTVSCISVSVDNTIWVSTTSALLKKYNSAVDSFNTHGILTGPHGSQPIRIEKILCLQNGNLLVGTLTRGVKLYDTDKKSFQDLICMKSDKSDIFVRDFIQMSPNEYWIATETGIYIYNAAEASTVHLKKEYDDNYSISDNVVLTFCRDREGGLWIGTYFGGLNYYPRQYTTFRKYFPEYSKPSISGNAIHEICKDDFGNLWVGTEDGGLNKIDLANDRYTTYKPMDGPNSIAYHNVHGLLASGDSLWVGTFMHGLDILRISTGKVIRHYDAGSGPRDFRNNFVVTIFKTKSGEILIGTENGLFHYDPRTDDFAPDPNFESQTQAIWEDEKGMLWVCSRGKGVTYYNPVTKEKGSLLYDAKDTNTLCNNYVNGIFEDSRHNFWFSTDGGICRYQPDKKIFTRYSTRNGMPDNLVFRTLEDKSGNLYFSTSRGLVCFHPESGKIKTYIKSNGLMSDQFNYNSSFMDSDGRMYFGSVKGMISFNPDEFLKNSGVPPVYITGLDINNHDVSANMPGSPLSESVIYTKDISLPYDQSTLIIDFAALSYTVPEMNEYAYKMEGLDKDWIFLKKNRKVYYTKLPPGNYSFKVKGSNSSGIWNQQEAGFSILITPPFWESIWAYIFYWMVVALISFLVIRSYLNRLAIKQQRKFERLDMEKEREIYHSKIEFFTNIAHEIRTPLTLIKMPLDKLLRKKNSPAEINYNLKTMEKNTNRLIDLTNQLLDFRNTEMDKFSLNFVKTDITDLINETFSSFALAAEEKNLHLNLEMPGLALQAFVDPEALRKILSNLFNNAIKYAEANVKIRLKKFSSDDRVFTIVIQNDGFLIPYDLKEKIFEPFYRIRETEKQSGNGIGLPLSRSLAELHKGVLDLVQPENGMNTFVLTLPIHQEKEFKLLRDEAVAEEEVVEVKESRRSSKPELLLVEDNREILEFICKEISVDYTIRKAVNGAEALEILKEGTIQLVISDIMMPVMDGLELCKRIKTNLEYSHIPIILLTAKNSLHAKIEGLEVGADAYIEKPFDFEHLGAQISNLLANRNKLKEYFANTPLTHIKTIGYTKADKLFLEKLKQVIDENLTNMDIDVEQLSKIMNMSRPTFYRKIKALSNLTPHELIHITRLKKAAELLSEGSNKVYEVSAMVGYSLQSNFARDFHKQFGMTPTEYMNNKPVERNAS